LTLIWRQGQVLVGRTHSGVVGEFHYFIPEKVEEEKAFMGSYAFYGTADR